MTRILSTFPLLKCVSFSSQTHVKLVGRKFPYSNFKNVRGLKINLKSYYFTCLLLSAVYLPSPLENRKSKIDLSLQIGKCIFSKTGFYFEIGTSSVTILPAFVHNNIESSQMLCWVYIYSRAIEITYFFFLFMPTYACYYIFYITLNTKHWCVITKTVLHIWFRNQKQQNFLLVSLLSCLNNIVCKYHSIPFISSIHFPTQLSYCVIPKWTTTFAYFVNFSAFLLKNNFWNCARRRSISRLISSYVLCIEYC